MLSCLIRVCLKHTNRLSTTVLVCRGAGSGIEKMKQRERAKDRPRSYNLYSAGYRNLTSMFIK